MHLHDFSISFVMDMLVNKIRYPTVGIIFHFLFGLRTATPFAFPSFLVRVLIVSFCDIESYSVSITNYVYAFAVLLIGNSAEIILVDIPNKNTDS